MLEVESFAFEVSRARVIDLPASRRHVDEMNAKVCNSLHAVPEGSRLSVSRTNQSPPEESREKGFRLRRINIILFGICRGSLGSLMLVLR